MNRYEITEAEFRAIEDLAFHLVDLGYQTKGNAPDELWVSLNLVLLSLARDPIPMMEVDFAEREMDLVRSLS
jgi:hypothetical protein